MFFCVNSLDCFVPNDEKGRHEELDLQDLQELQCFLMVHIAQNACKSKILTCILQNELRWAIIAHMFYLFKRKDVGITLGNHPIEGCGYPPRS